MTTATDRQGVAAWVAGPRGGAADARAVYDLVVAVVAGAPVSAPVAERAGRAPVAVWEHVLELEGCAAWLEHKSRGNQSTAAQVAPAGPYLKAEAARSVRNAVAMVQQLAELASVATEVGARVLVLKGGARLLGGEPAGARGMADIDLLVAEGGGPALHAALVTRLGYASAEPGTPARHLSSLVRAGSLPVEIHTRLSDEGSSLDRRVWEGTRQVAVGAAAVEIPGATAVLLHVIEHAVVVHRAARYRLRDVVDVGTVWTDNVDAEELRAFGNGQSQRVAMQTLVTAAARLSTAESASRPAWLSGSSVDGAAWRRIRRVGRARLWAPPREGVPPVSDPRVIVLSQLGEGSPGPLLRLVGRAIAAPRRAWGLVSGAWLPVEAIEAREASRAAASQDAVREPAGRPVVRG